MKMRVAASIAVTVLATTVLAGCQFVTPQQTTRSYTPADGVNGTAGDVDVRNAFVLEGAGDTASVIGVLSNTSDAQTSVTLQWTGTSGTETRSLVIPAGGLLSMSTDPTKLDASVRERLQRGRARRRRRDARRRCFNVTFSTSDGAEQPAAAGADGQLLAVRDAGAHADADPHADEDEEEQPSPDVTDSATPTPTPTDTLAG